LHLAYFASKKHPVIFYTTFASYVITNKATASAFLPIKTNDFQKHARYFKQNIHQSDKNKMDPEQKKKMPLAGDVSLSLIIENIQLCCCPQCGMLQYFSIDNTCHGQSVYQV